MDTSGGLRPRGIFQMKNSAVTVLATDGLYAWDEAAGSFKRLGLDLPVPGGRQNAMRIDTCAGVLFYPAKGIGICAFELATGRTRLLPFNRDQRLVAGRRYSGLRS